MTDFADRFAAAVAALPGVLAVSLGGSRARGEHRPDSDWDFALYYRGHFDTGPLRALGWAGQIFEPGDWGGGVMNGGAWLRIEDRAVDLHYRDLDDVEHRWAQARAGEYEVQQLMFHLAGIPTYAVVGELALGRVLVGQLPRPEFPERLRAAAPPRWHGDALLSLTYGENALAGGDPVVGVGNLSRALLQEAHARVAAAGEWVTNEKRLLRRAGLADATPPGDVAGYARIVRSAIER